MLSSTSNASRPSPADDGFGGVERETAREHTETVQGDRVREDRAGRTTSRPLAAASGAARPRCGSHPSAVGTARRAAIAISPASSCGPRRGELERERDPVEAAGELRDRMRFVSSSWNRLPASPARSTKRRTASVDASSSSVRSSVGRSSERTRDHLLPANAETLAAGRRARGRPGTPQRSRRQSRGGADQMLAVVEHDENSLASEHLGNAVGHRQSRALLHCQGCGDNIGHRIRVAEWSRARTSHAPSG